MMRNTWIAAGLVLFAVASPIASWGQPPREREQLAFFESRIRPVLIEHCYECHSRESAEPAGGLRLDTRQALRKGGNNGPAIVAGRPESSLLVLAIRHAEAKLAMPPVDAGEKLPSSVIADFERWIRNGAFDPRDDQQPSDDAVPQQGWAWQPLRIARPPADPSGWARSEIDRYVIAKLAEQQLAPAADADRATLVRRLAIDLTGLPPSPTDYRQFVLIDPQRDLEELVDRYLASPAFGERFGRHWLDVVRYAESSGKDFNVAYPHAWRYRDYVIDALNDDMPFDQFVREQIAGDLIEDRSADLSSERVASDRARRMIATGFLAIGPKSVNEMRGHQFAIDVADEQIDTLSQAFLGQTIACARCHDHKFDPITQTDYTALAGIFLSTETLYGTAGAANGRNAGKLHPLPPGTADLAGRTSLGLAGYAQKQERIDALRAQRRELQDQVRDAFRTGQSNTAARNAALQRINAQLGLLEAELANYSADGDAIALAMAVVDKPAAPQAFRGRLGAFPGRDRSFANDAANRAARFLGPFDLRYLVDSPLLIRGELERPGERVRRGIPEFLDANGTYRVTASTSGRLQLADAIVSVDNPLTSRVIANRVWAWTMGQGLVTTVDNFGNSGQPPTHPELLDHLADSLVHGGWSIKSLVKQIVLSRVYRLSSEIQESHRESAHTLDPDNRWYWRAHRKPISAEAMRDAMLAAAGMLQSERPSGSLIARSGDGVIGGFRPGGLQENRVTSADDPVRSVYLPQPRLVLPDALQLFDAPDNSMVSGVRETTIVPSQALYWLNSSRVQQLSEAIARRVLGLPPMDDPEPWPEPINDRRRPIFERLAGVRNDAPAGQTDQKIVDGRITQLVILTLSRPPHESERYAVSEYVQQRAVQGESDLAIWTSVSKSFLSSGDFRFLK